MELDPRKLTNSERYKLLADTVTPRPIAMVSSMSVDGAHNLAPFSWFNAVGTDPMALVFCPGGRSSGEDKDTLRNVLPVDEGGLGEFVINAAVESYARAVAAASESLEYGDSEFELTGLTPAPSAVVKPPRIAESPVAFECTTLQIIRLNPGVPGGGNLVIGEVVHIWIDESIIDERLRVDPRRYKTIGRLGGTEYATTRQIFSMPRGREALDPDVDIGLD